MSQPQPATERDRLALAALLHNIGVFYRLADNNGQGRDNPLDERIINRQTELLPTTDAKAHQHEKYVLWSAQWVLEQKDHWLRLLSQEEVPGNNSLFELVATHQRPTTPLATILHHAQQLAAGIQPGTSTEGSASTDWSSYRKQPLRPVFDYLMQQDSANPTHALPLQSLQLDDSYFPQPESEHQPEQYAQLWEQFNHELQNNQASDVSVFLENTLGLLQKYAAAIPHNPQHLPDVSVYDHARLTVALAVGLYDYLEENEQLDNPAVPTEDTPWLLVGGDLSGIQKFIYDVMSSDAAKNLKGRSFYLHLLAESIVQRILDDNQLSSAHVVYASGGGFFLLAPNTNELKKNLTNLENEVVKKIYQDHGTSLYLALAHQPISVADISGQELGSLWKGLTQKLAKKKRQRYRTFIPQTGGDLGYNHFFEPTSVNGDEQRDRITNEVIGSGEDFRKIDDEDDKPIRIITWLQILLGRELKRTDRILKVSQEDHNINGLWLNPLNLNNFYYLREAKDTDPQQPSSVTTQINNTDFLPANATRAYRLDFYGGNDFPTVTDIDKKGKPFERIKMFDELAGDEEERLKRLGILRMDVDSLGQLFIKGFEGQPLTFSRYSALSRSLDYFFKGYLNTIWRSQEEFQQNTYILYAGGDDLFIVGKWDVLIDFAKAIQRDFARWSCGSNHISLSGGIVLVTGKFPIAKAAELAEVAEKQAKRHTVGTIEKNSFTLFEKPLHWDIEFPEVEGLKKKLVKLIKKEGVPRSLLDRIRTFHALRAKQQKNGLTESWRWLLVYDMSRFRKDLPKQAEDTKKQIEQWEIQIFSNDWHGKSLCSRYEFLDLLYIAARWAALTIRI